MTRTVRWRAGCAHWNGIPCTVLDDGGAVVLLRLDLPRHIEHQVVVDDDGGAVDYRLAMLNDAAPIRPVAQVCIEALCWPVIRGQPYADAGQR